MIKKKEERTMANVITENDKTMAKKSENKVCAILYPITTVLWLFNAGMVLAGSISSGSKLGWNFWLDISIAAVFGFCAVDYILKYRKEKKGQSLN